jgi:hydrogenase expression/formation protein HypC
MCLAVLGIVTEKGGDDGVVDLAGNRVPTNLALVPEVTVGDYVLLHAGFAIRVVPREEAEETLRLLDQLAEAGPRAGAESP